MGEYYTTVKLTNKRADICFGQMDSLVPRRDGIEAGQGCPMMVMAGALGS